MSVAAQLKGAGYFDAGIAIVNRLRAEVPSVQDFFTPADLDGVLESSQPDQSIHVVYAGETVSGNTHLGGQQAGAGGRKVVNQQWMVVLAVRNVEAQLQHTTAIFTEAGVIVPQILDALQGWQPVPWMRPLARVGGAVPPGYSSSFAYLPFLFEGLIVS